MNEFINRIQSCDHLFIKLKDSERIYGFHSTDCFTIPSIVSCLKCGLTNKYIEMNPIIRRKYLMFYRELKKYILENNRVFKEQFNHGWKHSKYFDESVLNLISNEPLDSIHPSILYKIALFLQPNADNQELFNIMKHLHEIETPEERIRLNTSNVGDLIERYKSEGKRLIHEQL